VSFTAILVKVVARALQVYPDFNAVLDLDHRRLTRRRYVHVGVAADTPRGLLVPVLRHVDRKRVVTVSRELADLADRARDGKVGAAEMQGAGFTVSNIGGLDGGWFTPIINPPEVAILGIGAATTKPVDDGAGGFRPRPLLPLSLSYDHRAIDGAGAARFLRWLVDALENPLLTALEGSPS
jgi:pyruvate dehydrogenase E2 component (dihydrolipoamide acetyltransferase)